MALTGRLIKCSSQLAMTSEVPGASDVCAYLLYAGKTNLTDDVTMGMCTVIVGACKFILYNCKAEEMSPNSDTPSPVHQLSQK